MRTRFYALTGLVSICQDTSHNVLDGSRIEEVTSSRLSTNEELQCFAKSRAYELYHKEQSLQLFTDLESAQEYARERKLYARSFNSLGYWETTASYPNPWYQQAVVENSLICDQILRQWR